MRCLLQVVFSIFMFGLVVTLSTNTVGAEMKVVVPESARDGDGNTSIPIGPGPIRAQSLYLSSNFDELLPEGGAWLIAYRLRADAGYRSSAEFTDTNLRVRVGSTSNGSLDPVFDNNYDVDSVMAIETDSRDGHFTSDPDRPNRRDPNPFSDSYEFQKPFFYNPADGNLAIELQFSNSSVPQLPLDYERVDYYGDQGAVNYRANRAEGAERTAPVMELLFVNEDELCIPLFNGSLVLKGDFDGNGTVEFNDFLRLSNNFGESDKTFEDGDADCNGTIGFSDFLLLADNFGLSSL